MKPAPDVVLAVRVPPTLKRDLKKLAAAEKRSLSNLVELYLTEVLKQKAAA